MGQLRRSPTRRTVLSAAAALGVGCALPWQRTDSRAPVVYLPAATPVRAARLRLVLAREGLAPLDGAVRQVVEQGARELGFTVEVQDDASFVGGGPAPRGAPDGNAVSQRLLVAVQAGTPPDGVLLLGRQAQTMRLQGMGLVQEVSALMRAARARHGAAPEAAERVHVLAGSWFAVPFYQRLVGHFVRPEMFAEAGLDPEREGASLIGIREALRRVARPAEGAWGWGIGPADTADVDAWCWSVIHGWGGGLANRSGERVALASTETAAALEWLAATFREQPWREAVHPAAGTWDDARKNAAFVSGEAAYTYTERALGATLFPENGTGGSAPGGRNGTIGGTPVVQPAGGGGKLVPVPVGDGAAGVAPGQLRSTGGGAVWVLPRGVRAEPVERLWTALLEPAAQRPLWAAGGGFALPPLEGGWSDAALEVLPDAENARRYHAQLAFGGFVSYLGQGGPQSGAAEAVGAGRLAARMLRAVVDGRTVDVVLADAQADAVAVFRELGLPGA